MLPVESILFPPPIILFLLVWTFEMRDKCPCACDWRLNAIQVLLFLFLLTPERSDNPFIAGLKKPLAVAKIFYLPLVFTYLNDIDTKEGCTCGRDTTQTRVLFWVTCIQTAIFIGATIANVRTSMKKRQSVEWLRI